MSNAHLYLGGNYNVIATRQFKGKATVDTEANALRMANGDASPFDAGYCAALEKPYISLHDPALNHALKEVDGAALAVASDPEQIVAMLRYIIRGELPGYTAELAAAQ